MSILYLQLLMIKLTEFCYFCTSSPPLLQSFGIHPSVGVILFFLKLSYFSNCIKHESLPEFSMGISRLIVLSSDLIHQQMLLLLPYIQHRGKMQAKSLQILMMDAFEILKILILIIHWPTSMNATLISRIYLKIRLPMRRFLP